MLHFIGPTDLCCTLAPAECYNGCKSMLTEGGSMKPSGRLKGIRMTTWRLSVSNVMSTKKTVLKDHPLAVRAICGRFWNPAWKKGRVSGYAVSMARTNSMITGLHMKV